MKSDIMVRRFRPSTNPRRRPAGARRRPTGMRALARKVKAVVRRERMNHQTLLYTNSISTTVSTSIQPFCITRPSAWSSTFSGTTKNEDSQRVFVKNINTRLHISLNNPSGDYTGSDWINFSVFVFRIRDRGSLGTIYDNINGTFVWTAGTTHVTQGTRTYLNMKMFKVLKKWDFTLGNNSAAMNISSALAQSYGVQKILTYTTRCNKMLYAATQTNWASLPSFPDPSDNVFYVIFSDGVYTATQPFLGVSNMIGLRTLGQ